MKRKLLLLLPLFLLTLAPSLSAQCPSLFYDGFESGNWSPTWTAAGGAYTRSVVTTSPAVGTYCYSSVGTSSHYMGTTTNFGPATPPSLGFYVKTTSNTANSCYTVIGDANTNTNQGIIFFYMASSGKGRVYTNASTVYEFNYQVNTWYHLEFKNIDFVNKTYDIWLDGTQVATAFPFRSQASTNIDRMFLYNFSGNATAYYDDINVGGVSLNLNTMPTDVLCDGDSTGAATVNSTGGTPPYTYAWSSGGTSQMATGLLPGGYNVTVTDSLGCMGTDSATVGAPPALVSTTAPVDARCNGDSTGSVDLSVSGGTSPYTYLWSNGGTSEDPMGLPAGTYTVAITDTNGCVSTDTALIAEPTAVTVTAVVTDLPCHGDSSGAITATPAGGTPGYTYTWNTAASTPTISGLSGGTYSVFVTDSNGCSVGDIYMVNEPAQLIGSGVTTPDNGTNNGAVDLTPNGGTPPYTYAWSNNATTEDLSNLTAGTYTVTITDANGCTWTNAFVVDLIISIDEGLAGPKVDVVPNPTAGTVRISVTLAAQGPVSFQLTDLRGRSIFAAEQQANALQLEQEMNLSSLPAGVYLLQVESAGQRSWSRIVRQ